MEFKRRFSDRYVKFRTKLLLSYFFVVLLPIILIGSFLISSTVSTAINRTNYIYSISFRQLSDNIKNQLDSYQYILNGYTMEDMIMQYIETVYARKTPYYLKYQDFIKVNDIFLRKINITSSGELKVSIYSSNNSIIADGRFIKRISTNTKRQQWYKNILKARGKTVITGMHSESGGQEIIMLGSLINTKGTNIIVMEIPENDIYTLMEKEGMSMKVFLLDSNNNVLSTTERKNLFKSAKNIPILKSFNFDGKDTINFETKNTKNVLFYQPLNDNLTTTDLKVVSIVSPEALLKDIGGIVRYSILFYIGSAVIAILLAFLLSDRFSRRIKLLMKNMSEIKNGKFEVFAKFEVNDEIGELSKSFENMINRINILTNEVYLLEIKNKEAEISSLQSQINPHFLFNFMESIRMNLWQKGDFVTSEIIEKFATLLRKSIDWSKSEILLQQELELIATYLAIQKYRYGEKLNYNINVDESVLIYPILKFILQPIVENAIYHGIEMKKGKGEVNIYSQQEKDILKLIIEDNGVGIDEANLDNVRNQIYAEKSKIPDSKQIGIRNVHQRIKLRYGAEYGIRIYSIKGRGTRVEIILPSKYVEGRNANV